MGYDFHNLSPADFEDLARDLVGRELGIRFEGFAPGPDQGMDGRHSKGPKSTVLQAKHYIGSSYSALKYAVKRERPAIDKLAPSRYILATSRSLSPPNKKELASIIGPALLSENDIFSAKDLNSLLRDFSDIAKAHIKLWLSGAAILDRIVRSASYAVNSISRSEIEAKVRVYAQNPSLKQSRDRLERNHVLIISGPPGVGKSTLAEMLAYAHISEGWDYHAIRSLEDGFAGLDDTKKQVFYFDDFLGTVALDSHALSVKDSDLVRFIRRVRSSQNARFILTTRTHLFEEARRISERLADQKLDITRYALDVGIYTRRIRARILYNHLYVTKTPVEHIRALWQCGAIGKIIDHRNYNPRVIEAMTDAFHTQEIDADDYPRAFLDTLENPALLWDTSFREHISPRCKHLLITLFFCSEYGCVIPVLREVFEPLHSYLTEKYGGARDPKDFEEALRILEGGFITIRNRNVNYVNPSLRDYLTSYLDNFEMLKDFAVASRKPEWAKRVWRFVIQKNLSQQDTAALAGEFCSTLDNFRGTPVWSPSMDQPHLLEKTDLSNSDRISILIDWWTASKNDDFAECVLNLARHPVGGFSPWLDGDNIVELLAKLPDEVYFDPLPNLDEVLEVLKVALIAMLRGGMAYDDLERIADNAYSNRHALDADVMEAVQNAVIAEIEEIDGVIADVESEATLEDHIRTVEKLGARVNASVESIENAVRSIRARINSVANEAVESESPSVKNLRQQASDKFDDEDIRNLFFPLVEGRVR